ncbi:MAG: hypothetical protein K2Q25_09965 [Mycobacteriaceae bacterium]|nr:hypothetical protein [Mycobacteriaceae bacterium]
MATVIPVAQAGPGDVNPVSLSIELSAFLAEAGLLYSVMRGSEALNALYVHAFKEIMVAWKYLNLAQIFIEALETMNGYGVPDAGDIFQDYSRKFSEKICVDLQDASAISWSGYPLGASYNYNCRNSEQQCRANRVAEADGQIRSTLLKQSYQVEQGRQGFAGTRMMLIGVNAVVAKWAADATADLERGNAGDFSAQLQLACLALLVVEVVQKTSYAAAITALGLIITLLAEAGENASDIKKAMDKYSSVAAEASAFVSTSRVSVMSGSAVALESVVPSFSGIAEKLSERVAHFDDDSGATGSGNGRIPVGAPTQARGMPAFTRRPSPGPGLAQGGRTAAISVKRAHEGKAVSSPAADAAHPPGVPVDVAAAGATGVEEPGEQTLAERMGF